MRRLPVFFALLASSAIAHASDNPLYASVPAWVKPAPALDGTKIADDAPVALLLDNQQRLEAGQVSSYFDTATRAASTEALASIGNIQLAWQPAQGDLTIHRAEIIRGAEHIDLVKGGNPFTVIRREQQMEQRELDGVLTATLPVPGLSVGDILHVTFTITRRDPTLKGDLQTFAPLLFDPFRIQFARVRLVWPVGSDVRWKSYAKGLTAAPVTVGAERELTVAMPLAKPPELPDDAPARYKPLPIIEATSFADWAAVSKVMAPLYATDGLIAPGSPLAAEVDRIKAAERDPLKRAALALALVQDKIRYLLLGMDTGNYVPQTPAHTWSLRYGDCKAKTLLLLSLLHVMEIEAEPVLANTRLGDLVPERLPGAAAFDHVLVRATIAGETLWLDGTGRGARLADIHDTPALGTVLPLRPAGAALMPIVVHADARPDIVATLDYDQSAGLNLPATFSASIRLRGQLADATKLATAQGSKDDLDKFVASLFKSYLGEAAISGSGFSFDAAAGTATVSAQGIAYPGWSREDQRLRLPLDHAVGDIDFTPDRARALWHDIPVKTAPPSSLSLQTHIKLPRGGTGFAIDGTPDLSTRLAGADIKRSITLAGDSITIDEKTVTTGAEIAAADVPAERQKVALAKTHLPRALAPAGSPQRWAEVEASKRDHRLDPILAVYGKRIAAKPDDRERYTDRAWFLERIFERRQAIADLDKAIAIEPKVDTYLDRAAQFLALGDDAKALGDILAATKLDPASDDAIGRLAAYRSDHGEQTQALALLQDKIDEGGKDKPGYLSSKAELQARGGDKEAAIATIDEAVSAKPGDPALLNSRCWIKATSNTALDTALKDCTKAIELADNASSVLDSRAMVYFRLGRMEEAAADLDSALDIEPDQVASLYMRGIVRRRSGRTKEGDADLAAARLMSPQIDRDYKRYGILP